MINQDIQSLGMTEEQHQTSTPTIQQKGKKEKKDWNDPRFFKAGVKDPKVLNDTRPTEYQALIRILPRGTDYSKPYVVDLLEHLFKEDGVGFYSKCRQTLGAKPWECPICKDNWDMYNSAKKDKNKVLEIKALDRKPKTKHICNILVIKDLVNPQNDGKVMLWSMPNTIYKKVLLASDKNKPATKKVSAFDTNTTEEKEPIFYPQDPVNGRNLVVYVTRDPEKNIVTYDASNWHNVKEPAPLADTKEGITKILNQCNDLSEFTSDIPEPDLIAKRYSEHKIKVNERLAQGGTSNLGYQSIDPFTTNGNTTPNLKTVAPTAESAAFWAGTPPTQPTAVTAPMVQPQAAVPVSSSSVPEDDDLPF